MSFENILGHNAQIKILKDAILNNKVAHSYLFTGPNGIGKSLVAKTFAKALNCFRQVDSCDVCPSCLKIEGLNHPDIHWIAPVLSNQIKIEQIRQMQNKISFKPYEATVKVFVIDPANALNEEAGNCLLKTLEEPPKDSIIILIAPNLNRISGTIASRCQRILFFPLPVKDIKIKLTESGIAEDQTHTLAQLCEGSLGRAIMLAGDEFLEESDRLIEMLLNKDKVFVLNSIFPREDQLKRENLKEIILFVISVLRDLLVLKSCGDVSIINAHRKEDLLSKCSRYTYDQILEGITDLYKLYNLVEQNVNVKIAAQLLTVLG